MAKAQPRATELQQAGETASALTKRTERLNNQEPTKSSRPREKEHKINPSRPGAEGGGGSDNTNITCLLAKRDIRPAAAATRVHPQLGPGRTEAVAPGTQRDTEA